MFTTNAGDGGAKFATTTTEHLKPQQQYEQWLDDTPTRRLNMEPSQDKWGIYTTHKELRLTPYTAVSPPSRARGIVVFVTTENYTTTGYSTKQRTTNHVNSKNKPSRTRITHLSVLRLPLSLSWCAQNPRTDRGSVGSNWPGGGGGV